MVHLVQFNCDTKIKSVGAEDIFLGMGTKDPGTTTSDGIRTKIFLPLEDTAAAIELDVTDSAIKISSKNYYLHHELPRKINAKSARAKWNDSTRELWVTAPFLPGEFDFLRQ